MCTKNTFTISWSSFGALIGILTPINLGGCLCNYLVIKKTEKDTLANTTDTEDAQDQLTDRQRSRLVLPCLSFLISLFVRWESRGNYNDRLRDKR